MIKYITVFILITGNCLLFSETSSYFWIRWYQDVKQYLDKLSQKRVVEQTSNNVVQKIGVNTILIIQHGDITKVQAEAIVNAANPWLKAGGGVCGAIFDAAGHDKLQKACDLFPPDQQGFRCPVGSACLTHSFNLEQRGIKYIIHAVGPDCRLITDTVEQKKLLRGAYKQSLEIADKHRIESIAFPFISSAIYACPRELAASEALFAISEYVKKHQHTHIKVIRMVLFSIEDYKLFVTTMQQMNR